MMYHLRQGVSSNRKIIVLTKDWKREEQNDEGELHKISSNVILTIETSFKVSVLTKTKAILKI